MTAKALESAVRGHVGQPVFLCCRCVPLGEREKRFAYPDSSCHAGPGRRPPMDRRRPLRPSVHAIVSALWWACEVSWTYAVVKGDQNLDRLVGAVRFLIDCTHLAGIACWGIVSWWVELVKLGKEREREQILRYMIAGVSARHWSPTLASHTISPRPDRQLLPASLRRGVFGLQSPCTACKLYPMV